jgi:hypothetical protein
MFHKISTRGDRAPANGRARLLDKKVSNARRPPRASTSSRRASGVVTSPAHQREGICTDPHSSVVLIFARMEIAHAMLRPKLPPLRCSHRICSARAFTTPRRSPPWAVAISSAPGGRDVHLVLDCEADFTRRSVVTALSAFADLPSAS